MILKSSSRQFILVLMWVLMSCVAVAQQLAMPEGVSTGTLKNGLTYYIVPNGTPGKVQVKVVSKIGSLAEGPDQHGLAHFLEHTVFNGSENYPNNSSVEEIQNMGMRVGVDYNAYTSPQQTEYFMTITENNLENFKKSLLILRDWMFFVQIDPEQHENEKMIIIEEIRSSGRNRTPPLLTGTPMEGRSTLGTIEEIESVTVDQLNAFYKDNYSPEQLALIVYGRIDEKKALQQIRKIFGAVSYSSNKVNSYPGVNHQTVVSGKDKNSGFGHEKDMNTLAVAYKTTPVVRNTYEGVKQSYINNILCEMLARRFKKSESSISRASANIGSMVPDNMIYNFRITGGADMEYKKLLDTFCQVMAQAQQYGFSADEIAYYTNEQTEWLRKNRNSESISVKQLQSHFLKGTTPLSGKTRYQLASEILPKLTPEDFLAALNKMLACHKTVLYDETSNVCSPDFEQSYILDKLNNLENFTTQAYEFKRPTPRGKKTINIEARPCKPGLLKGKEQLAENLSVLRFENGSNIVLHHTEDEKVLIRMRGKDGLNIVDEGDRQYYKRRIRDFYTAYGTYESNEAFNMQRALGITQQVKVSDYDYEYTLNANADSFEEALKILNLTLTEPVCPDNRELVKRIKTFSKRKPQVDKTREFEKQLEIQWLESKPDTTAMESLAQRLYQKSKQLSTNFRNSIVYISGNLPDNAEDLVARYIASVQASVVPQNQFSVNVPRLAKGGEAKEFEWNNKKMAKVKYLFTALPQKHFQLKDELMLEAIRQFAVVKMNEIMRDKYGLIYAIGVTGNAQTYPRDFYSFNLRYMLDTASVEKSKKVMLEEVLTPISKGEISKQELEKVKAMVSSYYVMSFYDKKQIGDRWLRWALKYDKIASPKEISKLIDSISLKELQELMKQVVDVENHFVILQNPKVSKEEDKK